MPRGKSVITKPIAKISAETAYQMFERDCRARNLRDATIDTYKFYCRSYINYIGAETDISLITKDNIQDWILAEQQTEIKDVTVVAKVRHVRAWVYYLMREGLIPAFKLQLPKADEPYKEPYTIEELKRLLAQPSSSSFVEWRTWALISFLIGTGCRISTALSVKIEDINFEEGFVSFTHLKNRRAQVVPLSSALINNLQVYLNLWNWRESDYLFNNSYETGSVAKSTAQQEIRAYNRSRNVNKTSAHLFRHTFSKNYIMAGGGVFQLQRILGHADISTTRHYVQLYNSDLKKDYDNLCPLDNLLK